MKRFRALRHGNAGQSGGFVIVGAVMFVLALTILGLSLFGLSSYEAQFLNQSADQLQAFYDSQGWMERSRYVLSQAPHELIQAQQGLPDGVTAVAIQVQSGEPDSIGRIEGLGVGETGEPILIRVTATHRGATRTIEAQFDPHDFDDYYKRVISVSDSLYVNDHAWVFDRCETIILNGGVRLGTFASDEDTSWVDCLLEYNPSHIEIDPLPAPDVNLFFSQHPTIVEPQLITGPEYRYDINGDEDNVTYYTSQESGTDFTFFQNNPTVFSVTGHNVWMLASGFRASNHVRVEGDPANSSLVIVSGRNETYSFDGVDYFDAGIWFFGGLESSIPLILVSDGGVYVEQYHITHNLSQYLPYLSIYAGYAFLTGPETGTATLEMTYDPSMNNLIDWLASQGALPNATSASGAQFTMIPGSWRELVTN